MIPQWINKEIARNICLAQIASDAGKGFYRLSIVGSKDAKIKGYAVKDKYILKAISLIDNGRGETLFRYFVTNTPDQNGVSSKIIYFTFMNGKERYQISFHSFGGGKIKEKAAQNAGLRTSWDHKSSIDTARFLANQFNLENQKPIVISGRPRQIRS